MFFRKAKSDDSHRALADAQEHKLKIQSRHVEVVEVAGALREVRRKNHFAEQITLLMGKKV